MASELLKFKKLSKNIVMLPFALLVQVLEKNYFYWSGGNACYAKVYSEHCRASNTESFEKIA